MKNLWESLKILIWLVIITYLFYATTYFIAGWFTKDESQRKLAGRLHVLVLLTEVLILFIWFIIFFASTKGSRDISNSIVNTFILILVHALSCIPFLILYLIATPFGAKWPPIADL